MDSTELLLESLCSLGFADMLDVLGPEPFSKSQSGAKCLEAVLHALYQRHKGTKAVQKVHHAS